MDVEIVPSNHFRYCYCWNFTLLIRRKSKKTFSKWSNLAKFLSISNFKFLGMRYKLLDVPVSVSPAPEKCDTGYPHSQNKLLLHDKPLERQLVLYSINTSWILKFPLPFGKMERNETRQLVVSKTVACILLFCYLINKCISFWRRGFIIVSMQIRHWW